MRGFVSLRLAYRRLRASPAFALSALATIGIGVGASTALFGAIHALLLRPLPFPDPERLGVLDMVWEDADGDRDTTPYWSYPKYRTLRQSAAGLFDGVAAFGRWDANLVSGERKERVTVELVGGGYMDLLGVRPEAGRVLRAGEGDEGEPVAVLGAGLARRLSGTPEAALGRTVRVAGVPVRVVGVAAPSFAGLSGEARVWVPLGLAPAIAFEAALEDPGSHWFGVLGRVAPGVGVGRVEAQLELVHGRLQEAFPASGFGGAPGSLAFLPLERIRVDPAVRRAIVILFAATALVLGIVAANLANLQLARADARRHETAVRRSLGAGRGAIVGDVLSESLLLAVGGGAAGALLALYGTDLIGLLGRAVETRSGLSLATLTGFEAVGVDVPVLLFALGVALATGVAFGVWPALRASTVPPAAALARGRGSAGGASAGARPLVALEIALAVVLVAGAGVALRSLAALRSVPTGLDVAGAMTARVAPDAGADGFWRRLADRLDAESSVLTGASSCLPLSGACNRVLLTRLDDRSHPTEEAPRVAQVYLAGDPLRALGVPLLSGRLPGRFDGPDAPPVVLVNRAFERRYLEDGSALGHRVGVSIGLLDWRGGETAEVVGVVGDVRWSPPESYLAGDAAAEPTVFVSVRQHGSASFVIASGGDSDADRLAAIRRAVTDVDPTLPLFDVASLRSRLGGALARPRILGALLAIFAGIAVMLAAVGVNGVLACLVGRRAAEIGIRVTLGATPRDVVAAVLAYGIPAVATGVVAGLAAAVLLHRVLEGLVWGVDALDPLALAAACALLAAAALAAAARPAWRAARLDPMTVLRKE